MYPNTFAKMPNNFNNSNWNSRNHCPKSAGIIGAPIRPTCKWAIWQVWPADVREQAWTLLTKGRENPSGDPHAKLWNPPTKVAPGTWDQGCMQINDHAQAKRIQGKDVWDAITNAQIGLEIYRANADTFKPWCGSERAGLVAPGQSNCHKHAKRRK